MTDDAQMIKVRYKLVGPNAGNTVALAKGRYRFENGIMEVEARSDHVEGGKYRGLTRQLARSYNAHPEGSEALKKAEAEWYAQTGKVPNAGGPKAKAGKKEAAGAADDGEGNDDSQAGSEGHGAEDGDGLGSGDGEDDAADAELIEALGSLDADNNKHWTSTGFPNLKVVGELLGRGVTRTEIEAAIPGFNRQKAAAN